MGVRYYKIYFRQSEKQPTGSLDGLEVVDTENRRSKPKDYVGQLFKVINEYVTDVYKQGFTA